MSFSSPDWTLWYDYANSPDTLAVDSQGRMWARVRDEVSYFDGLKWIPVNPDQIDLVRLSQLHIAHDGSAWVLGRKSQETFLAHFDGKNWTESPLPGAISTSQLLTMAIDSNNQVWVSAKDCYTDHCLFAFTQGIWQEESLPVREHPLGGADVISDTEGHLWVAGGGYEGIAELLSTGWHIYHGTDLWPDRPFVGFRSAEEISMGVGDDGSIWAYLEATSSILHLKRDGEIETVPIGLDIDFAHLSYIHLHESRKGLLWVGTDPRANFFGPVPTTLGFFDGRHWVSFTDLPFKVVYSVDETPDGTTLVLTDEGLYRYAPR